MTVAEHDRRRQEGIWLTGKQFLVLLTSILSVQMGVNWYAAQRFVKEVAVEVVHQHNTDTEAHARALMVAQQERHDMVRQIVVLQTKIDGLEAMIRSLAAQGVFNTTNGNGKTK
jgi:hypothetical protein